jgi:hypothetical protein
VKKKDHQFPYLEKELTNLDNEIWKDIPFLDGLYHISNLGRVKRLNIERVTDKGHTVRLPSKIMSSYLSKAKNSGVGDYIFGLSVCIRRNHVKYKFSVGRMVYYCFKKEFPLENRSLVVLPKDGNGKNLRVSNLRLADHSQKQRRIFERGRWLVEHGTSYDEYLEGRINSKNPCAKQVSQYDRNGIRKKTFPSIAVAEQVTGVKATLILSVLKERSLTAGRFVWAYGMRKKVDVVTRRKSNLEKYKKLVGTKVSQYNLEGHQIATFITIKDAGRTSGVNASDIHAVLKGRQRSAGGYIWRRGVGKKKINTKGLLTGEAWRAFRRQKKVIQLNAEGKIIKHFPSVTAASEYIGLNPSRISVAISKSLPIGETYWEFGV